MADYAIINNLTSYATELIQTNPNFTNNLASQVNSDVKSSTGNNYGISYVTVDLVGKKIWYDIDPLTASAKVEMKMASLGTPSAGWFDTVKTIIAAVLAAAVLIIGFIIGGWAILAGAVIAGAILLYSYLTNKIEYSQDMVETDDEYARQLVAGEITQAQYDEFTAMKHKAMENGAGEIPWNTILIVGGIAIFALVALMIITRKQ